jgi:eukaryotic-like serine/threonine-protein kinase
MFPLDLLMENLLKSKVENMSEKGFLEQLNDKGGKPESFQPEHFEKVKKSNHKNYFIGILLISGIFGVFYLLNRPVVMIDMVGMNKNDAMLWADNNEIQFIYTDFYNDTTETGKVISQSVPNQTKLNKASVVELTISKGIDPDKIISLPLFDNSWNKASIIAWIEENHISNYQFISVVAEGVNDSTLLDFFVESKDTNTLKRSDRIVFNIATQPVKTMITMSDLSNLSQAQVENWALTNGIETIIKTAYSNSVDKGKVISQDIMTGANIESGSTVLLVISRGPAIKIVDFQTFSPFEAKQWASQNNIQLTSETKYHMTIPTNKLISQSISLGTWVASGSKINVVYSLGNKLSITDFVNQPLSQLESFVINQNSLGAELSLHITYQYSNVTSVNRVVYIEYRDTKINIDSEIEVIVSLGGLVKMPDLSLLESTDAEYLALEVIKLCETSGLTCKVSYVTTEEPELANEVIYQSIEPNVYISDSILVEVHITKLID